MTLKLAWNFDGTQNTVQFDLNMEFQNIPMVSMEERVCRCDTIDINEQSQHNFALSLNEYYSF